MQLVLAREKLHGDHLWLDRYGAKHRTVKILLPPDVVNELQALPHSPDAKYFFWRGHTKRRSEVSSWEKIFANLVHNIARGRPDLFPVDERDRIDARLSMLRHTFAVEYLLAGMSIEDVSFLLGHSSVVLTQQLYAPWLVRSQRTLAANQRAACKVMESRNKEFSRPLAALKSR